MKSTPVADKVLNLGQWEKAALFSLFDFIAKNQLALEGAQSVVPVIIPALTTISDLSPLRNGKPLTLDLPLPAWLKQTIMLCYKKVDQQARDLVKVKEHDIRAFAPSKVVYDGVSVDQIIQACH